MPKRLQLHMSPAFSFPVAAATPNRPTLAFYRRAGAARRRLLAQAPARLRRDRRLFRHDLVRVAPAPALARLDGADHRMLGGMVMLGGVGVGRRVAATDVAAGEAKAEMDPATADLEAFLTASAVGFHFMGMGEVWAHSGSTAPTRRGPIFPGRRPPRKWSRGTRAALGWAAVRLACRCT